MFNITNYVVSSDQKKLELYTKSIKDFKEAKSLIDFIKRISLYDDTHIVLFEVDFFLSEKKIVISSDFLFKSYFNMGENYESIAQILNNNGIQPKILLEEFSLQTETTPLINTKAQSSWRKLFTLR